MTTDQYEYLLHVISAGLIIIIILVGIMTTVVVEEITKLRKAINKNARKHE